MRQQCHRILLHFMQRFRIHLCPCICCHVWIFPFCLPRQKHIFQHGKDNLNHQISNKILSQDQDKNLKNICQKKQNPMIDCCNISFLIRNEQILLIRRKVCQGCISHIEHKNEIQIFYVRNIFGNQPRDKRGKQHAQHKNHTTNQGISLAVYHHDGSDLLFIFFCQRPIQAKYNRRTNPQLHQRQHGKNLCKKAIDPQHFCAQLRQKNPSGKKHNYHVKKLKNNCCYRVYD